MGHRIGNSTKFSGSASIAVLAVAMMQPVSTPRVKAQALQPVVDVCTGITLPRSAVTDIIGAVNQPIVNQIETTVNGITTVTLVLSPLASIPDLNIDLTSILADAAAGDPISLQILDTEGNTIATNAEDISALDTRVAANTSEIDSLDGRVTEAEGEISQIDARVAVAEDQIVDIDGRVASNSSSLESLQLQVSNVPVTYVSDADGRTTSSVTTNTAAFAGADGGAVRVTNVADGTLTSESTDAVNGRQLYATNLAVSQNASDIQTINNNLAGSTVVAVQYSDADVTPSFPPAGIRAEPLCCA